MLHIVSCIILVVLLIVAIKVYIPFVYKLFDVAREFLDRMYYRE